MMGEKRFTIDNTNRIFDNKNVMSKTEVVVLLNFLSEENEKLRQVVEQYRKTNKHLSELCADASKNGYLPPLEDLQ